MQFALMIEGQNGLTWPRWQAIALAAEELGFAGLYRSDHFTNANPPDKESLELWTSLTWLASHTQRIEFGPMVSPVSFRHPVFTARMAKDVDDLSGGRLTLGVGAGWQEREHAKFHFDLLDLPARFDRFEEGLEIITRLLQDEEPVTYAGRYYALDEAILLPRSQRPGGPPILIGGNGPKRTLPLVARFAQEWNAVYVTPQVFAGLNAQLDDLLLAAGRQPNDVRRSLMTGLVFGRTDAELQSRLDGRDPVALREQGLVVGTPSQVAEQAAALADAGVERLLLQWMELDDLAGVAALAETVMA
ncbi:MAG: LLM class F420-dependent oxidoreductase [Caldilineaceae bacterium]|nr:LLM class F420-dependent oxidoreductase [Caldilineaceae bacterium]MBP8124069.1 LLM class F420-dependent oxidoreductase [Caldilineaceae bacterium]MBP9074439.1 LLM class F420-dependent oxidoreductase [Caldilineaceae bacterium]